MEVEYSLELEDLLAFNQDRNAHSPTIRRQHLTIRVFFLLVAGIPWLLGFGIVGGVGPRTLTVAYAVLGLAVAVFVLSYPALARQGERRLASRMYMEGQNRSLWARQRLTITPETITDATEISVTTMKWVAVEKIAVDQRHTYFYTSALSAIILPKAAFPTEEEFRGFVEIAQRYQHEAAG
jgi:hypothetical protein